MQLAATLASFSRTMRRCFSYSLPLVLAVSTLSAISVVSAPIANATTNSNCVPSVSGLTATGAAGSNNTCVITITGGTGTWTPPSGVRIIDYFMVAGGGGGGARGGGGGGAGGIAFTNSGSPLTLTNGNSIEVSIGGGGTGGNGGSGISDSHSTNGGNSYFSPNGTRVTVTGGGGGGSANASNNTTRSGNNGGSGGGATTAQSGTASATVGTGIVGPPRQGYDGGPARDASVYTNWPAGGGGGATSAGLIPANNTTGGTGGSGIIIQYTDTPVCYATGGGGGIKDGQTGGSGGDCLGVGGSTSNSGTSGSSTPSAARANSGSGGGGSGFSSGNDVPGGAGAAGIVLIKYSAVYTVTYNYNSATGENSTVSDDFLIAGTPITLPVPTRTGYSFLGWYEAADFSGSALGLTYSSTQSRTIYAKWILNCSPSSSSSGGYTVLTFTAGNGCAWTAPVGVSRADVLVVGGGGGGSGNYPGNPSAAGSGGGGGVYTAGALPISGTTTITVGAGGTGGSAGSDRNLVGGSQGGTSAFGTLSAGGGGGGGCASGTQGTTPQACVSTSINGLPGTAGGSGGSPSNFWWAYNYGVPGTANSVTIGGTVFPAIVGKQGGTYISGSSAGNTVGSGGGAGSAGSYNTAGNGVTSALTGNTVYGRGGSSWDATGWNLDALAANTGFGGNGAYSATGTSTNGVSGSSGIVILRYDATLPTLSSTGVLSTSTIGTSLSFTSSEVGTYFYKIQTAATTDPVDAAAVESTATANSSAAASANSVSISGLTNNTSYEIFVIVKDPAGNRSSVSTITFSTLANAVTPSIGTQPLAVAKNVGQSVTFSVVATASDSGALTYQWQKGGVDISLATSETYTFTPSSTSDAGDYRVVITNTKNSVTATTTSNVAKLAIAGTNNHRNFVRTTPSDVFSAGNSFKSSSAVIPSGSFTIEGWFKEGTSLDNQNPIFSQGSLSTPGFGVLVSTSSGRKLSLYNGNTFTTATTVITQGKWHHYAVTYDSTASTLRLFLNGSEVGSQTSTTPVLAGDFFLGQNSYYPVHNFHGQQDQFKVWTSALTATEILTSMHSYGSGDITGKTLRTLYDFNQSSGSTLTDVLGTFNLSANGTGTSSTWASSALSVIFDEQGGSSATDTTFDSYTKIADPGVIVRSGYALSGWSTTTNGAVITFPYIAPPLEAITLYAIWTANTNTVTFDANSGTSVSNGSFVTGGNLTKPTNPTKAGKIFGGWSTSETSDQGNAANLIRSWPYTPSATAALTLYAIWNNDTSIEFSRTTRASVRAANQVLQNDRSFTWEAWIYPTGSSISGTTQWFTILDNGYTDNNYGRTWMDVYDTGSGPQLSGGYWNSANNGTGILSGANTIRYNAWQHVALRVERTGSAEGSCSNSGGLALTLFIDGVSKATASDSVFAGCITSPGLIVGEKNIAANQAFKGKIDQVKIWEGALASAEIISSRSSYGVGSVDNVLRAHYGFNELGSSPAINNPIRNLVSEASTYDLAIFGVDAATVTNNVTRSLNSFTVSFNGNNSTSGTVASEVGVLPYQGIAAPGGSALTKSGYTFSTWNTKADGTGDPYSPSETYVSLYGDSSLYAVWAASGLTVTYNSKGGSAVTAGAVNTGASISAAPTAPTKDGYTFAGWSATDGGSVVTFPYAHGQIASFSLYAIWTPNSLTITYNSKGGTAVSPGAVNTAANISAAPTAPTKGGYTFAGWSATDGGSVITFPYTHGQTAGFTLFAIWNADSLTVTYNSKGGTAVTGGGVNTGASISAAPTAPTKDGYTFAGWSATDGGSVVTFPYAHGQTVGFTLFAIWTPDSLTVTYNSKGGTAVTAGAVNTGANISTAPTVPTKAGYSLAGWSASDGGSVVTFPYAHGQTVGFTLYAIWTPNSLTITYNSKGGSAVSNGSTVTEGAIAVAPAAPTKANYTFAGWSATDGGTAITFPYAHGNTAGFTLYALWTANAYVLTYVYNSATSGNTTLTDNFTTGGTQILLPTPSRTGYDFAGWYADALFVTSIGAGGAQFGPTGSSLTPTAYAKWTGINRTVTYSATTATDGAVPTDAGNYILGSSVVIKANSGSLVRTGYTFAGWTYASDGTGSVLTSGMTYTTATSNMVFYAKWTANTYTVTYNKNGASGSPVASTASYTTAGDAVTLTTVGTMAKTGFDFSGWSASPTGSALSGTYTTAVDITLYAVWTIKSISITFSKGDASLSSFFNFPSNRSSNYGTTITLSDTVDSAVTIGGTSHAFMGWNDGTSVYQSGATYLLGETAPTFTAVWVKIFAVRYAFNGGTAAVSSSALDAECLLAGATCTDGQVITANAAPTRDGYTFAGWVDQFGVAVTAGQTFTVRDNRYLIYANWTPIDYSITYNTVGGSPAVVTFTKQMGQTFVIANAPTKTGYSFAGWSNGSTIFGAGVTYFVATSPVELTAQWTPDVYTVVYDWNGGSGSTTSNGSFTVGSNAMTLPVVGDHVKDGYTFAGWSTSDNGTLISGGYTPTANSILYAIWGTGSYTLTYNGNGGTVPIASAAILNGSSLTLPTPTRENFVFDGWYTDASAGSLIGAAAAAFQPTQSRTVYARWIQSSLYGLSPSVLSRVGVLTASDTGATTTTHENANSSVTVAIPAATLPAGTTINIDRVGELTRAQGAIAGNNSYIISVVVSWITSTGTVPSTNSGKAIAVTITNASIKAGAKVYGIVAGSVTLLTTATQNGTVTVQLTSDPEVVVIATKPDAPTNLAVTSGTGQADLTWSAPATDGGSEITGYTVTGTGGVTCTTTTTSCNISGLTAGTAYTFTATASNALGTSDASTSAGATTTSMYVVSFDAKGGSNVSNGSFLAASTVSAPSAPSRSGYTFAGWSATDGGAAVTFPYAPGVTNNISMYARWTAIDHAVTFNSNGGSAVLGVVFATGGTVSAPTAPTRSGYIFAGWSATDGGSAVTFPYAPGVVTGITLFAKWTQNAPVVVIPTPPVSNPTTPAVTPPVSNVIVTAPVTVVGNKDAKVSSIDVIVPITEANLNSVSVKVDKANEKFIAEVKVVDSKLVLTPMTGFSGRKTVTVTITEYGVDRLIQVPLTVLPEAVSKPVLTPTSSNKSIIRWTASPNATSYSVYLNGKRVCPTASTSCSVPQVLGPDSRVEVTANGADRTFSEKIKVDFKQTAPVLITKIFSETLAKAKFTSLDVRKLDSVIALAKTQGFKTIVISDITKTTKTEALAATRIAEIKKYIASKTDPKKIAIEVVPAASRTYFNNISVKG